MPTAIGAPHAGEQVKRCSSPPSLDFFFLNPNMCAGLTLKGANSIWFTPKKQPRLAKRGVFAIIWLREFRRTVRPVAHRYPLPHGAGGLRDGGGRRLSQARPGIGRPRRPALTCRRWSTRALGQAVEPTHAAALRPRHPPVCPALPEQRVHQQLHLLRLLAGQPHPARHALNRRSRARSSGVGRSGLS